MQFGFVPGRGTTDAILIIRQLQKYITANKQLYLAFDHLEKAINRVPRKVLWKAMSILGVEEWAVLFRACTRMLVTVCESTGSTAKYGVGVGVHQGSVLIHCSLSLCTRSSFK